MTKRSKKYWEMNKSELAAATREFDREFVADTAQPMTPAERAEDKRARLRGRPRVGQGALKIHITLERGLVKQADRLARQNGWGRSELIARALVAAVKRRAV